MSRAEKAAAISAARRSARSAASDPLEPTTIVLIDRYRRLLCPFSLCCFT
jgi:hypothetical protein